MFSTSDQKFGIFQKKSPKRFSKKNIKHAEKKKFWKTKFQNFDQKQTKNLDFAKKFPKKVCPKTISNLFLNSFPFTLG